MPSIAPFRGLRYNLKKVKSLQQVVTPPYDVISPTGQARYYRLHPYNFIRLVYGKTYSSDTASRNRYTRAHGTFKRWVEQGILQPDPKPSIYPHCQEFTIDGRRHQRWGVMTLVHLDSSKVYPHENIRPEPKTDRLRLLAALKAPLSPIFGLIPDRQRQYQRFIERACRTRRPVADVSVEGVGHILWRVDDPLWIKQLQRFLKTKELVIADGHHRYQAALEYRQMQRKAGAKRAASPDNYAMFYLASSAMDEPGLLATHRVLEDLPSAKRGMLLENLKGEGSLRPVGNLYELNTRLRRLKRQGKIGIGLYTGNGHGYLLESSRPSRFELDVEWLHQGILPKLKADLEITYTPHLKEAATQVRRDHQKMLFVMQPPTLQDVLTRARASLRMPRKTTYFYPKPLAGLVEYSFEFR